MAAEERSSENFCDTGRNFPQNLLLAAFGILPWRDSRRSGRLGSLRAGFSVRTDPAHNFAADSDLCRLYREIPSVFSGFFLQRFSCLLCGGLLHALCLRGRPPQSGASQRPDASVLLLCRIRAPKLGCCAFWQAAEEAAGSDAPVGRLVPARFEPLIFPFKRMSIAYE